MWTRLEIRYILRIPLSYKLNFKARIIIIHNITQLSIKTFKKPIYYKRYFIRRRIKTVFILYYITRFLNCKMT